MSLEEKKRRHYEQTKRWAQRNPEAIKAIRERYRSQHRAQLLEKKRSYARVHSERGREISKRWRAANLDRVRQISRKSRMIRRFGLTPVAYEEQLRAQDNRCAICGEEPSSRRLAIDHDHLTGTFRGLLCRQCNTMLGKAKDSVKILRKAISYLTAHHAEAVMGDGVRRVMPSEESMLKYRVNGPLTEPAT